MPKLVYAEPDDEITNLVDRLRSEKSEKELVFVLPAASRVMHSSLNARLLMQYSNSLGKRTSVVSPDPRTQGVAIETGFNTFSSMAAFEDGRALDRAVEARSAATPPAAPPAPLPAMDPGPTAATRRALVAPGPVASPRPRPLAAGPAATTAAAVATERPRRRLGFLPLVLGALGLFLVATILLLFVLPSATVTITVAARAVTVAPTITGATQPPAAGDNLAVQTALQNAQEQQQQQVGATGQKVIPGAKATGTVTVSNRGGNILCCVFAAGSPGEVSTADGKKFGFVPDSTVIIFPGQSHDFAITSKDANAGGNVPPHAITKVTTDNPLVADNQAETKGGVDPQNKTVVSQADLDRTKAQVGAGLSQKIRDELKARAGKDTLLGDTVVVDLSISADHQPGDEVSAFNATVTAKGRATSVNEDRLKQVLRDAVARAVIAGYHLTDDQVKLDYREAQHDDNGGVVWEASASGFQASAVNEADLRQKIAGKSPKEASSYVQGHMDALTANVVLSPSFAPWLPFIANNIHFRTQVQNTTPG